jgi:hypothetical protein
MTSSPALLNITRGTPSFGALLEYVHVLAPYANLDNPLLHFFLSNRGPLMNKWLHYFDIYDKHFHRYRGKPVRMIEIGIYHGGSLSMWKDYFGDKLELFGVDINPRAEKFADERTKVYIGDQSDPAFLASMRSEIGQVDIVLDDGGHACYQQIASYRGLFDMVAPDGVYMIEDCHTSYWDEYGGGLHRKDSFLEFTKQWIDEVNSYHVRDWKPEQYSSLARSAHCVSFYDSVVVVEKRPKAPPVAKMTGRMSFLGMDE